MGTFPDPTGEPKQSPERAPEAGPRWHGLPEAVYDFVNANPNTVLLETSRFDAANHRSFLFVDPVRILIARQPEDLLRLFSQLDAAAAEGLHVAGFFSYECGYSLERTDPLVPQSEQVLRAWFGVYASPYIFDHARGEFERGEIGRRLDVPLATAGLDSLRRADSMADRGVDHTADCGANRTAMPLSQGIDGQLSLGINRQEYDHRIRQIKELIAAGETYQVNFTDAVDFETSCSAAAVYRALLTGQRVSYGAWCNLGEQQILSFSPELFFRIQRDSAGRKITVRPMKGTMPRGLDTGEDELAARRLQNDEKNRSEHVMIVDLMRNDLGRICETGTIQVEDLFSVERFQTLLQMTSTISGQLRSGVGSAEMFRSLFPSGSVTGAPKIRTMQIIRALERQPRGIYTGSIGYIAPSGESVFNVAIRTLVMSSTDRSEGLPAAVHMGVGGGIVADSEAEDEYRECQLKCAFLTRAVPAFQLIETMRWEGEYRLLSLHLDRMEDSATYFDFHWDRRSVLEQLNKLAELFRSDNIYRVRMLLGREGELSVEFSEFQESSGSVSVKLSGEKTSSGDLYLRHKTTHREMYHRLSAEARAGGFDEVLFANEKGEVTEGAVSNIFIEREGKLLTPPICCGVLPGVFRRQLLETVPNVEEGILTVDDLKTADAIYLSNSLRGLRKVTALSL